MFIVISLDLLNTKSVMRLDSLLPFQYTSHFDWIIVVVRFDELLGTSLPLILLVSSLGMMTLQQIQQTTFSTIAYFRLFFVETVVATGLLVPAEAAESNTLPTVTPQRPRWTLAVSTSHDVLV